MQYGIELDRRKIEVEEVIHRTGSYAATADFGQGATGKFTVEVAPEVQGAHGKASQVAGAALEFAEGSEPVQAQDEVATGDTAVDDTVINEADATADDAATDDLEAGDTAQG